MAKKKKWINALIFIGGLIVFLFYYFEDKADIDKVEKEQDKSALDSAEVKLPNLSEDLAEFEENNSNVEEDSSAVDTL